MARLTESDLGLVLVLWKNRSTRVADFVPALLADIAAANREIEELKQQLKKPQPAPIVRQIEQDEVNCE